MKRFLTLPVCVAVLLPGCAAPRESQPAIKVPGHTVARSVQGSVIYTVNGASTPLKPDQELAAGATITTGPHSTVDLRINDFVSEVQLQPDSTLAISTMVHAGYAGEGDSETRLELKAGSLLGHVNRISANSIYEIATPHGVANIHGATDFAVTVAPPSNAKVGVAFTSVKGEITVSAVVETNELTKALHDGESWAPGFGEVHLTRVGEAAH
jgi:hypothetical protein